MLGGAVAGAVISRCSLVPRAAILAGWDVAVVVYVTWVWVAVWWLDPGTTARLAKREDTSTAASPSHTGWLLGMTILSMTGRYG